MMAVLRKFTANTSICNILDFNMFLCIVLLFGCFILVIDLIPFMRTLLQFISTTCGEDLIQINRRLYLLFITEARPGREKSRGDGRDTRKKYGDSTCSYSRYNSLYSM